MTQLVGIARDVDGGDTAVATLKGHRVNRTVFAAHHEAGQTVDSRVAHLNGGKARVLARTAVGSARLSRGLRSARADAPQNPQRRMSRL
jgi:hypothetical protein